MGNYPFMLHAKPAAVRWARFIYRWWQKKKLTQESVGQQIIWLDALVGAGFHRRGVKQLRTLLEQPVSRHQQFQIRLILACAYQGQHKTRKALEELRIAATLAKTTSQKAEVLQREGKCRVDLGHWQRAHWCFEHAFLLRQQVGLLASAKRSERALDALHRLRSLQTVQAKNLG
ncbi:hypothetical protein [Salinibius halmophilus]|uniref:hypothetical protein n=1 Tax=Salinibius halmophilus TaxID=1853216 RepID=UPI000E666440|nr:hypothetical protein [Salinibius halmophilus]